MKKDLEFFPLDWNRLYQPQAKLRQVRLLPRQLPQRQVQHHLQAEVRLHEGRWNESTLDQGWATIFVCRAHLTFDLCLLGQIDVKYAN